MAPIFITCLVVVSCAAGSGPELLKCRYIAETETKVLVDCVDQVIDSCFTKGGFSSASVQIAVDKYKCNLKDYI